MGRGCGAGTIFYEVGKAKLETPNSYNNIFICDL